MNKHTISMMRNFFNVKKKKNANIKYRFEIQIYPGNQISTAEQIIEDLHTIRKGHEMTLLL